jgi:hypothetical protein
MGGFFVPGQGEYSLPTPDSLSHSFGGFQGYNAATTSYPAQPGSYASQTNVAVNYGSFNGRTGTPSMGISPSEVSTLGMLGSSTTSAPAPAKGKHSDGDGLSEKRRRRRESHNAVERRRRDNINERIGELAGLIPGVLFECDGGFSFFSDLGSPCPIFPFSGNCLFPIFNLIFGSFPII